MLRKITGSLFGFVSCLSGMSILAMTLLQGQAKIDNLIAPPSNWDLAIIGLVGLTSGFLAIAIWPNEKSTRKNFYDPKKIAAKRYPL